MSRGKERGEKSLARELRENWNAVKATVKTKRETLKTILAIMATLLVQTACSNKETIEIPEEKYGAKENVELKIEFQLEGINSKATSDYNDQLIENVNIFITDEIGNLVYKGYHRSIVELKIEAHQQMKYTIYAVANAGKKIEADCAEDIENLEINIPDISYLKSQEGAVLMSGKTAPQKLDKKNTTTVYLTRCVSKISIKADYTQLKEDVEIQIKSIKLRNAPNSIKLFKTNKILKSSNSINGDAVYNIKTSQLQKGIIFYQFENMQGTLQPENTTQQQKQWPEGSLQEKICSYIELSATYSSPRKYGDILYRFYLGGDMLGNYDIKRNTQQNITINFINEGAVEENTWRVDNGEIIDLITEIRLSPDTLVFTELETVLPITPEIYPSTAQNKNLEWYSSDEKVAQVDNHGNVMSIGEGKCQIYACSTDGTGITAFSSVIVKTQAPSEPENPGLPDDPEEPTEPENPENPENPADPENPTLPEFKIKEYQMYDGQTRRIEFTFEAPEDVTIRAESSDPSIIRILEISRTGIIVDAPIWVITTEPRTSVAGTSAAGTGTTAAGTGTSVAGTGSAAEAPAATTAQSTITAYIGDKTTKCTIEVEKLRIEPQEQELVLYNHFYKDVEYKIYPEFAAQELAAQGMTVEITTNGNGITTYYEGIGERIIPQYETGVTLPLQTQIKLVLSGREDVQAEVPVTVKPMLKMIETLTVNANWGNSNVEKSLELEMHPRAQINFSWAEADGKQYYGSPGEGDYEISAKENKIIFPVPNSTNGLYRLIATVTGDDGYGAKAATTGGAEESDAAKYCNIAIYETIYLTGISKTIDRNRKEGEPDTWEYENEIVAKWLSHPNSLLYPQGEVELSLPFSYNGKTYTENHTGETEKFTFEFEKGEQLKMALETEITTYNGNPPQYYLEYFKLQPAGNPYITGNPATGEPYLYIYSRHFVSGFSKTPSPDWEKIFEIIYP